jgi:hypothetical protein
METMYHFLEGSGRVLQAALEHQDIADKAIHRMNLAVSKLERRNEELRRQIQQEVKTSLESSVRSAVDKLVESFQDADTYAQQAAWRYKEAVRDANRTVLTRVRNVLVTIIISFTAGLLFGKFYL